ncbi:hypothetical protein [Streptomyces paludis]|uniref:Uncharacterized protein n=1 Tax=Streptomyces paludis TaxID=2282738 RepID=A0A345HJ90_9ACTN|nr:hypothetical protein [Streptomyces paludis]AXG76764.1 hypothetical protein DVK44_02690 [Streptomyces paludis]
MATVNISVEDDTTEGDTTAHPPPTVFAAWDDRRLPGPPGLPGLWGRHDGSLGHPGRHWTSTCLRGLGGELEIR